MAPVVAWSSAANPPKAGIANGRIRVKMYLPDPANGFYRFTKTRTDANPWGLKAQLDDAVAVADLTNSRIPLKKYAPAGWTGRIHISFMMKDPGPKTRAKFPACGKMTRLVGFSALPLSRSQYRAVWLPAHSF